MATVQEAKQLIPELCKQFYEAGWVSGTGGGMSIRVGDMHVVAPSGVQKERMRPEDLFILSAAGVLLETPQARPPPYKPPKLSECYPLFQKVSGALSALYAARRSRAVLSLCARVNTERKPAVCRPLISGVLEQCCTATPSTL